MDGQGHRRVVPQAVQRTGTSLILTILGCPVVIHCTDAEAAALLRANYGGMEGGHPAGTVLRYTVGRTADTRGFLLQRDGATPQRAADTGALLFLVEKDVTIALQTLRPELYFLHAAVLDWAGTAIILAAASGQGKSTLTWALLHHGFRYASDELAPVDLQTLTVVPYPHALCLKQVPPAAYPLPAQTLVTPPTLHIPTVALPTAFCNASLPLSVIFFVQYRSEAVAPCVRPLRAAEAAVRLFSHALNPLAHAAEGLDAAIAIAQRCRCFALETAALPATCVLVCRTLHALDAGAPPPAVGGGAG
jgi:hypothetical protein